MSKSAFWLCVSNDNAYLNNSTPQSAENEDQQGKTHGEYKLEKKSDYQAHIALWLTDQEW